MTAVAGDDGLRTSIGRAAAARAAALYSWDGVAVAYERLFDRLLRGSPAAP
jgi:glycosyltransferase involved in cell wall biosynthesis